MQKLTGSSVKLGNGTLAIVGQKNFTFDPSSLADGVGQTQDVTVPGAALGDYVLAAARVNLAGITVTAYVKAANTVSIRAQNESGGTVDLSTSTWSVKVIR